MESSMTPHMKWAIGGIVVGLILLIVSPWLALALIVAGIAIPTAAYLMLDESQRRRLRETRRLPSLGSWPDARGPAPARARLNRAGRGIAAAFVGIDIDRRHVAGSPRA